MMNKSFFLSALFLAGCMSASDIPVQQQIGETALLEAMISHQIAKGGGTYSDVISVRLENEFSNAFYGVTFVNEGADDSVPLDSCIIVSHGKMPLLAFAISHPETGQWMQYLAKSFNTWNVVQLQCACAETMRPDEDLVALVGCLNKNMSVEWMKAFASGVWWLDRWSRLHSSVLAKKLATVIPDIVISDYCGKSADEIRLELQKPEPSGSFFSKDSCVIS